jgi:hypothetical protein
MVLSTILYIHYRRKIRLIECMQNVEYLKKYTCKGILRQVFICLSLPPTQVFVWGGLAIL